MKVTISLDKHVRFSADLPKEEATKYFSDAANKLVEEVSRSGLRIGMRPSNILVDPQKSITKESIEEAMKPTGILVAAKCPECGDFIICRAEEGQTIHCHQCNAEIEVKNLTPGKYECPNCGQKSFFEVIDKLDEVRCKGCGGTIDMAYHEKKKMYLSVNLINQ